MTTEEIAHTLKVTSQLMELHNENPFKVKSLGNAAFRLSKTGIDLEGLGLEELEKIEGIGKGIATKIVELQSTGTLKELDQMMERTPKGVIDMLQIKGIGPKKVAQLWKELEVESIGELLYACHENRLVDLKGFGSKTQDAVMKSIEFIQANSGKMHYASIESLVKPLLDKFRKKHPTAVIELTGQMHRMCEIVDQVDVLASADVAEELTADWKGLPLKLQIHTCTKENKGYLRVKTSAVVEHLHEIGFQHLKEESYATEAAVYEALQLPYVLPELREGRGEVSLAKLNKLPTLIEYTDLKGCLHNHSTYSDGIHTLKQMATYCKAKGLEYFGIADHSQTAVYANGLKPERIIEQHKEINQLNKELAPFKIFKGIESDILGNGQLDYPSEMLASFDYVVASVHSNLKMDEQKATERLIKAIENPYTTILGHPTGRLLLSRPGYPLDHKKIIDACAANGVAMELNAHPYRLDIDWRWIPYCLEKGVMISIDPDAHEEEGILDMYYGVCVARKGWLTKEMCLNAMGMAEFQQFLSKRKGA
jgi:DNA polymerase (family X)